MSGSRIRRRPLQPAIIALLLQLPRGTPDDPCDPAYSDSWLSTSLPVRVNGCDQETFLDEDSCLRAPCFAAPRLAAEDAALDEDGASLVCLMIRHGWWRAARTATQRLGQEEKLRVRRLAEAQRAGASEVVQLLLRGGSDRMRYGGQVTSEVVPACQWAQSGRVIALAVRFSPKKHGPVSVASVTHPRVELSEASLTFRAHASGKPLVFALELSLAHPVVVDASNWTSSTGRYIFNLAKAEPGLWPSLMAAEPEVSTSGTAGRRPPPLSPWFEMQELFDGQAAAANGNGESTLGGRDASDGASDGAKEEGERGGAAPLPAKGKASARKNKRRKPTAPARASERPRWDHVRGLRAGILLAVVLAGLSLCYQRRRGRARSLGRAAPSPSPAVSDTLADD